MSDQPTQRNPCPYPDCGSTDVVPDFYDYFGDRIFKVTCLDCGASGPHGSDSEEAIEKWNSLHQQQAADAERYRWLRDNHVQRYTQQCKPGDFVAEIRWVASLGWRTLDGAIDAAMKREGNSE